MDQGVKLFECWLLNLTEAETYMYKHVALTQTQFHTWPQTSAISSCSHSCHVILRLDIRHTSTPDPAVSSDKLLFE